MNHKEAVNLLERFYDGTTSESDEQQLLAYLGSEDVPEDMKAEKDIILALISISDKQYPDSDFENRLREKLQYSKESGSLSGRRRYLYSLLAAAATVIMAISMWYFAGNTPEPSDTYSSPELAYAETMRTLIKVSEGMNRGISALSPVGTFGTAESAVKVLGENGRYLQQSLEVIELFSGNAINSH